MKRVLAILFSVALVAAAIVVRSRFLQQDNTGSADTSTTSKVAGGRLRLLCEVEFQRVCNQVALAGKIVISATESAATTADRLAADPDAAAKTFDAWLVPAAWLALVNDNSAATVFASPVTIARSPLTVVGLATRLDLLTAACSGRLSWSCLLDRAGKPWSDVGGDATFGALKLAPSGSGADGFDLAVLGQVFAATNEDDNAFRAAARRMRTAAPGLANSTNPLRELLIQPRSSYDVVGVPEVVAVAEVPVGSELVRRPIDPPVTVDVAVVPVSGRKLDKDQIDALRKALIDAGWKAPGDTGDKSGLPGGRPLFRVRDLWREVTR